jgi:putative ABC transport system permease protein
VAVAITIMLGVGLFIASAGAFANLNNSYQATYDRLNFADLVATGGDSVSVAAAAVNAGTEAVEVRTQLDPAMLIGGTKLIGRVAGLPSDSRPSVNDIEVIEGEYLDAREPDGVVIEEHAAKTFELAPGDTLQIYTATGWQTVTLRGVAVSAEYIWPARSRQEVLSDPYSFAVVFAPQESLERWTGSGPNQVLATLPGGADDPTEATVSAAMTGAGATDITTQQEQPSPATLQLDLNGFSAMSWAFPALFLSAAAMASYVLLARRVRAERPIIGTLMASGAHRARLVRHYLLQGLLIGLVGAVAGIVLGVFATGAVTSEYTKALGIPDTIVSQHPWLAVAGLLFGLLVGLIGAAVPALTAARTVPAAAMRNETVTRPPGWWSRAVSKMTGLPVSTRLALRDVARNPRRTAATALGAVLALILVLASVGMMSSMQAALQLQYDEIEQQDATVTTSADTQGAADVLAAVPGVTTVERSVVAPVVASADGGSYATVLQGFTTDTTMHGFYSVDGTWLSLPPDGVLAGSGIATTLDVRVGDQIVLTTPTGSSSQVRVAGFLDEPLGTYLYADTEVADTVLTGSGVDTYLVQFDSGVDRDAMRRAITDLDGVVAYADSQAFVSSVESFLGLFWAFVAVMVLLGAVLALAIIYVTMAVSVVERTNELATLTAAGVPLRRVGGTLATENLLATLLGIPIGLVLGVIAAEWFLGLFSSDLFQLPLSLGWWALLAAAVGVLLAALLSQWPAVRAVGRLDIARIVRERSG